MLEFIQINLKKSFVAAIELNKKVSNKDNYVVLATKTYNFNGKVISLPKKSLSMSHENPRAAIIFNKDLNLIKIEQLTNRDCAVGLLQVQNEKVLVASIYLDIKLEVVQPWLENLVQFARKKKYAVIIGMDLSLIHI